MSLKDGLLDKKPDSGKIKYRWYNRLSVDVKSDIDDFIDSWLLRDPEVSQKLPTKSSLHRYIVTYYSLSVGLTAFKSYIAERLDDLKRLPEETSG